MKRTLKELKELRERLLNEINERDKQLYNLNIQKEELYKQLDIVELEISITPEDVVTIFNPLNLYPIEQIGKGKYAHQVCFTDQGDIFLHQIFRNVHPNMIAPASVPLTWRGWNNVTNTHITQEAALKQLENMLLQKTLTNIDGYKDAVIDHSKGEVLATVYFMILPTGGINSIALRGIEKHYFERNYDIINPRVDVIG
jgi:hypothetical protein